MTVNELKDKIQSGTLEETFLVLVHADDSSEYISDQYISCIAKQKGLELKHIEDLNQIPDEGLIADDNLYIFKTDKLEKVTPHNNLIIICNSTKYPEAVKIPKLEHWQFVDYLYTKVPGMNKVDLEWLITQYQQTDSRVTSTNYFRLENDIDKIAVFDKSQQDLIFNQLYNSGEYNTISNLTMFDLTSALIKHDVNTVLQVLKVFDYIDSKPHIWLLSILLNNLRNIIGIQLGINTTPQQLGISDKQFYVIKKYNCGHYSQNKLISIYEMLTDIENKFKFGGLTQEQLADYIICKILE